MPTTTFALPKRAAARCKPSHLLHEPAAARGQPYHFLQNERASARCKPSLLCCARSGTASFFFFSFFLFFLCDNERFPPPIPLRQGRTSSAQTNPNLVSSFRQIKKDAMGRRVRGYAMSDKVWASEREKCRYFSSRGRPSPYLRTRRTIAFFFTGFEGEAA
jgi:hypothetical protein